MVLTRIEDALLDPERNQAEQLRPVGASERRVGVAVEPGFDARACRNHGLFRGLDR